MLLFTAFDDADKILRPTTWYLARLAKRSAGASIWELSLKKRLVCSLARYVAKLNAARPKS